MEQIIIEFLKEIPSAAAVLGTVFLFLKREEVVEANRVKNAEALETKRQLHEIEMNKMWGNYITNIVQRIDQSNQAIVSAVKAADDKSDERWQRLGITQDLIDSIKAMPHGRPR